MREDTTSQFDLTPMGVAAGSEDGIAWWAVGPIRIDEEDYGINDVAVAEGRLVILGATGADSMDDPGDAAIWVSPPLD